MSSWPPLVTGPGAWTTARHIRRLVRRCREAIQRHAGIEDGGAHACAPVVWSVRRPLVRLRVGHVDAPQRLLADLEVARRGQQRREVRVGALETFDADDLVAAASVPRAEELLAGMRPGARDQQFEPDRSQSAFEAPAFDEVEE